ncbi:MAG TPA: prepilin-type N-terminal cleavage/methylation domain-containing protein [Nitrospiraceae bacterium]
MRFHQCHAGRSEGFTLLEVLIALGILALALPILLGLRNWDLELHAKANEITTATMLAQEKLLETEVSKMFALGETTGDFRGTPLGFQSVGGTVNRAPNYRWKRIVTSTPLSMIREVKIQILWPKGPTDELVEVSTYILISPTL